MVDEDESNVKKWIIEHGLALEMRVAQAFKGVGFSISQFEKYIDPESGDIRQVDVVAWMSEQVDSLYIKLSLYIECKYMKNPWILFSSSFRTHELSYFSHILDNNFEINRWQDQKTFSARLLAASLSSIDREKILGNSLFKIPDIIGHSLSQMRTNKDTEKDNAFNAIMQAVKCIAALELRIENEYKLAIDDYMDNQEKYGSSTFSHLCEIGFPIIVVKGKLFEAKLDQGNEISITPITHGLVYSPFKFSRNDRIGSQKDCFIWIITEDEISQFTDKVFAGFKLLLSQDQQALKALDYEKGKLGISLDSSFDIHL